MANLAESVDANIEDIAAGMGMDSRIGPSFLRAGLGYGGSCFPKDVAAFHWVAQQQGLNFQLLEEVRRINEAQREVFFNKVRSALWTLRGKRLAALGLAFKGGTDDIRESPAIDIIQRLLDAGAHVSAYDPAAMDRAREAMPPSEMLTYAADLYEAAQDADAALILTEWNEFAQHRSAAAEPRAQVPHRDRRPQSVPAGDHGGARVYLRQHRPPGQLQRAGGQAEEDAGVSKGPGLLGRLYCR